MPAEFLTCDQIGNLDGGVARALINAEIAAAVADVTDRGEQDGKPRQVVITIEIINQKGQLIADVRAKAKCPDQRSGLTIGESRMMPGGKKTGFRFQSRNPENPMQPTFEDLDENERA